MSSASADEIIRAIEEKLRGRAVPDDLRRLAALEAARPPDNPWADVYAALLVPGRDYPLLSGKA